MLPAYMARKHRRLRFRQLRAGSRLSGLHRRRAYEVLPGTSQPTADSFAQPWRGLRDKLTVLVQREMENWRAPLASIARASAGWVTRPNATATVTRKQHTETATGFKKRSGWVTI